ncbi:MAG: rRNA maturation RNase YbeY [Pirellulales bacterium]
MAASHRCSTPRLLHPQANSGSNKVVLCNRQRKTAVCSKTLKRLLLVAMDALGMTDSDISLAIVDDKAIAVLHETWLGISGPTDVLSFDLSSSEHAKTSQHGKRHGIHGEIIASAETALREARVYSWSSEHELTYYLIHGLLHLVGYDDQTPSERISMRRKERAMMKVIGLPSPPRRRPKTTCHRR